MHQEDQALENHLRSHKTLIPLNIHSNPRQNHKNKNTQPHTLHTQNFYLFQLKAIVSAQILLSTF